MYEQACQSQAPESPSDRCPFCEAMLKEANAVFDNLTVYPPAACLADFYACGTMRCDGQMRQCLQCRVVELENAIRSHRSQRADDRCIEDDDRLYAVLRDGIKCDRRVGSKEEMLANCKRFIERRCEGGGWPTYAELEAKIQEQEKLIAVQGAEMARMADLIAELQGDDQSEHDIL